jgi:hypothetical protein
VILLKWKNSVSTLVAKEFVAISFPHGFKVISLHTIGTADDVSGHRMNLVTAAARPWTNFTGFGHLGLTAKEIGPAFVIPGHWLLKSSSFSNWPYILGL